MALTGTRSKMTITDGECMKITVTKQPGGILVPADDRAADSLNKFKTGEQYEIEIKLTRNPQFHRKVFAFFNFCYEHWCASGTNHELMTDTAQFDVFRKNLTVLAGYYDEFASIRGSIRVEAKSLAYASMSQEEFSECYSALINAAIKHVFGKTTDQNVINQLYSFF